VGAKSHWAELRNEIGANDQDRIAEDTGNRLFRYPLTAVFLSFGVTKVSQPVPDIDTDALFQWGIGMLGQLNMRWYRVIFPIEKTPRTNCPLLI
jgi:hypothetical protein